MNYYKCIILFTCVCLQNGMHAVVNLETVAGVGKDNNVVGVQYHTVLDSDNVDNNEIADII